MSSFHSSSHGKSKLKLKIPTKRCMTTGFGTSKTHLSQKQFALITFSYSGNRNFFFIGSPRLNLRKDSGQFRAPILIAVCGICWRIRTYHSRNWICDQLSDECFESRKMYIRAGREEHDSTEAFFIVPEK